MQLRPFTADEFDAFTEVVQLAFQLSISPEDRARYQAATEFDRTIGAYEGTRMIGTFAAYTFELTAPGAVVAAAGVTAVTVHPTRHRRGVLSAMMGHHLDDLHENREALSVLRASESSIYGRFGFAPATREVEFRLDRAFAALVPEAPATGELTVDLMSPAQAAAQVAKVYDTVRPERPGFIGRNEAAWAERMNDPERAREGATPLRVALAADGAGVAGYALYRIQKRWNDGLPAGEVLLNELVATTPAAATELWRHLTDLDLTAAVSSDARPVDEPLMHLLRNPRQARPKVYDGLWLRLVRLGEALAARRYAVPVDLVLQVTDARCPWNARRWRLSGDETGATCEPSTDPPDLWLDTAVLAAAYLGDPVLSGYASAGRIDERRPGALRRLAAAMGGPTPWCPHHF